MHARGYSGCYFSFRRVVSYKKKNLCYLCELNGRTLIVVWRMMLKVSQPPLPALCKVPLDVMEYQTPLWPIMVHNSLQPNLSLSQKSGVSSTLHVITTFITHSQMVKLRICQNSETALQKLPCTAGLVKYANRGSWHEPSTWAAGARLFCLWLTHNLSLTTLWLTMHKHWWAREQNSNTTTIEIPPISRGDTAWMCLPGHNTLTPGVCTGGTCGPTDQMPDTQRSSEPESPLVSSAPTPVKQEPCTSQPLRRSGRVHKPPDRITDYVPS